jgi:predicted nucleic acid-binding protein
MTAAIFVDTNVFLHALDAADSAKQAIAAAWLERLWKEATGRTSVQVLAEFHVNATQKRRFGLSPDDAWTRVRLLHAWRPLPVDVELMESGRALQSRFALSWWDCLIVAAAQEQHCAVLLTEDLQDGARYDDLVVRNPFALDVHEPIPNYPVEPAHAHPRRGRPRKSANAQTRP